MQNEQLIKMLNASNGVVRTWALKELKRREIMDSSLRPLASANEINLNVHTDFSFSPYSPSMAVYMAYKSGIKLACACNYGTLAGTKEFIKGCEYMGISALTGFEVTLQSKALGEHIAAFYCVGEADKNNAFGPLLEQFRKICIERVKLVCDKINSMLEKHGLYVDFNKEILPLTKCNKGGNVTLKHLYMAVGKKIIQKFGQGKAAADFIRSSLCCDIEEGEYNLLCDYNDPFYEYDLISALRNNFSNLDSGILPPDLKDYVALCKNRAVIIAYQYDCQSNWIKNLAESDKLVSDFKALLNKIQKEGFNAVCISAKNLSSNLLCRIVDIIKEKNMLAIFTEKTEYPRNHFECAVPKNAKPYIQACAYAILGNDICHKNDSSDGLFAEKGSIKSKDFNERLMIYSNIGKKRL
ncbi:MAG: hypothetical protein IJW13_04585 [Clostridia bacterium]|nr:hypothetical protein [Clostridia bacterium]